MVVYKAACKHCGSSFKPQGLHKHEQFCKAKLAARQTVENSTVKNQLQLLRERLTGVAEGVRDVQTLLTTLHDLIG